MTPQADLASPKGRAHLHMCVDMWVLVCMYVHVHTYRCALLYTFAATLMSWHMCVCVYIYLTDVNTQQKAGFRRPFSGIYHISSS